MKRYLLFILFTIFSVCGIHAEFSLVHKGGLYDELMENGMQQVHTETKIIYANPGDTLRLYRPERPAFTGYVRWYCYDTDKAAKRIIYNGYKVSAWNDEFTLNNECGLFKRRISNGNNRVTDSRKKYFEVDYIMHTGDSTYRVAVDQSIYYDYFPDNDWRQKNITTLKEPTLSKRLIYEMHPATEIASIIDTCIGDNYLEVHNMIAPTGRQLYIGPNYIFINTDDYIGSVAYEWIARSNYYFNAESPIQMGIQSNWKWQVDGGEELTLSDITTAQFIAVNSNTPGIHTYTLRYKVDDVYYNVAKFIINFIDVNVVGPLENIPQPTKTNLLYEQTFNYDKPGTTDLTYWNWHFNVDESSYGYYISELDAYRDHHKGEPNWCEYGVVNKQDIYGTSLYVYNHHDTISDKNSSKFGYLIFVDGSERTGQVFNLKLNADLCPGSKMYFSSWVIDASTNGVDKCAPNLDFIVTGIDDNGNEHDITTFTTGEFGINAVKEVGKNGKMERGKWFQIMFPVEIGINEIYTTYRLKIMNKGKSGDGNDFAIDDIRIYVQKPPVNPIQASTYDCPSGSLDSITTYLRVDYQAIDEQSDKFYYQWRDFDDDELKLFYFNNFDSLYGSVDIPKTDSAIIASGDTCSSLLSFDAQYFDTNIPVVKYVKEHIDLSTERYVMYIAQPMVVRTNYNYTGYVAVRSQDLGSETKCGTKADLLVAGGTRILINDEALGDSVVGLCGNRSYKLDIVLTYITQNETTEELEEHTTPCSADWLVGDSTYVNNNIGIYKYTFQQIEDAVEDYRTSNPTSLTQTIVRYLLKENLLVLDTGSIAIEPTRSLSYTAFPRGGSAENGMSVCLTPRFLHLTADDGEINMMIVGSEDENIPDVILDRPRIVRISNAQKENGSFELPLYLSGDTAEYIIDSVYIISTTAPVFHNVILEHNKDTINLIDTVILSSNNLSRLEAGYDYVFHIAFVGESAEDQCNRGYTYFTLRIVPDVVTWYGGTWNEDDNWDTFIPMKETNVLLLPDKDYTVTFNDSSVAQYDINYTENECDSIYFPDGASMYGQEYININGVAFIDIKEYAWKWTLTAIPIKGVVSGDLFVHTNEIDDPFNVAKIRQDFGTSADDRTTWQLYRKEFDAIEHKWLSATNSLNTPIVEGQADMIGVDCVNSTDEPIIRLPKQDNMYRYYGKSSHNWLNIDETIDRDKDYGKPIWDGEKDIILKETYDSVYLLGNPTFGYINIDTLINDNLDLFTGDYYFVPKGATSIPKTNEDITYNRIWKDGYEVLLPPYRGILLKGKDSGYSIRINVKPYVNKAGRNAKRRNYHNENIATDIDYVDNREIYTIYDIMGHRVALDYNKLTNGVYILRRGNNTYKVFIGR